MKKQLVIRIGNILMGLGLAVMVLGIVSAVVNQLPGYSLPVMLAHGTVFAIFVGALLWLAGARLSGREKIADRYYWLRRYGDKRCRRHHGQR